MGNEREVSREEFLAHLHALIYNETDEPCTLYTEATVYDRTATMQPVGNLTISWFVDWTPEWLLKDKYERNNPRYDPVIPGESYTEYRVRVRSRSVDCNHTGAGLHYGVKLPQFGGYENEVRVIEEEEQIAATHGLRVWYVIGQKADRYGIGKRGDPPGVDFDPF